MVKKQGSIAKINLPLLSSGVFQRKRLFRLLDKSLHRPVIWIAAPAGAGKTTAVASYIQTRRLPCLWYQIDAGDGDIASFFHYMGLAARQAAPRRKKPLPHLTPEYLSGLQVFTRNYFRELFSRLNSPANVSLRGAKSRSNLKKGIAERPIDSRNNRFVIVLDNYQEAPADSLLHEVMLNGLSEMPDGINVIIIGRLPLPPAMSRLRASESLTLLDWGDIRLTVDESIGIGRLRMGSRVSASA